MGSWGVRLTWFDCKACQATSSDGKRYRGLCKPNRLSFNYCLVDNSEIQIKLIERRNDFDLVRENSLRSYGIDR